MKYKESSRHFFRLLTLIVLTASVTVFLAGCGSEKDAPPKSTLPKGAAENDILSLTAIDQNKEIVTIHYEYGLDNAAAMEKSIENKFPDVDVVMVFDGAADSLLVMKNNLENGKECDIVMGRYLNYMIDTADQYFLDLSGENFINNFYLTSLDSCVRSDGSLFYLPGPSDVIGIIYDKTVFEENGWNIPGGYTEFKELVNTIDNAGLTAVENFDGEEKTVNVRAIRPSLVFADSYQALFNPFSYDAVFAGAQNMEWLVAYQRGEGSLVGHLEPFAEKMKQLVDDGIVRLDDWDYMPRYRMPMLCDYHSTVMIVGPQNTYANARIIESDHEYAMMPFWTGDEEDTDYLYSLPTYFMGINKAAAGKSKEHKKLLLEIMGYICSVEAQSSMFGEGNSMVSNIKGVPLDTNDFNAGIQKTIQEGRIISDFYLLGGQATSREVEEALNNSARDMLTGKITVEEWLKIGDTARDNKLAGQSIWDAANVGACDESLTRFETALYMGGVYRDMTGTDIALVYVSSVDQGANCPLYAGTINSTTVRNMAPDRTSGEEEGIASGTLTGQQIMDCLNGFESQEKSYYVASGLNVSFAPWMPAGERLISCKLPDGTDLDPNGTYKVSFMSDKLYAETAGGAAAFKPDDISIIEGKWSDTFPKWLNEHGGVVKKPELTTKLIWTTKE